MRFLGRNQIWVWDAKVSKSTKQYTPLSTAVGADNLRYIGNSNPVNLRGVKEVFRIRFILMRIRMDPDPTYNRANSNFFHLL